MLDSGQPCGEHVAVVDRRPMRTAPINLHFPYGGLMIRSYSCQDSFRTQSTRISRTGHEPPIVWEVPVKYSPPPLLICRP